MNFRAPVPFKEALDSQAARTLLPTDLRTTLLREIDPELRRRSVLTAGGTHAGHLQQLNDSVQAILTGTTDRAKQRGILRDLVNSLGYRPAEGEEGTLTDFSDEKRINLQLDTNVQMMQSIGRTLQGDTPAVRDQYPAWELVRFFGPADLEKQRNWPARWTKAGGEFFDGRMIARKDAEVWQMLGSTELFDDGLDNPYAPFAFNSGMDRIAIDRDEAMRLGIIGRDEQVAPANLAMNDGLQTPGKITAEDLQAAIIEDLRNKGIQAQIVDGVLKYIGGMN